MLLLAIATAAVLAAALIQGSRLPWRGTIALAMSIALLAQGTVVAIVGFSGIVLRSLEPTVLLALAIGLLAVTVVAVRIDRRPVDWRYRWRSALGTTRDALRDPAVALGTLVVVVTLGWRTILAVRLPVVDYDGYSYHLVFVDVWLQHNAITQVPQRPWTAGYPANTELLTTWLAAFTRSDTLAGLTSVDRKSVV